MINERYLVDGKYLTEAECIEIFRGINTIPDRQEKALKLIEGNLIVDIGCYVGIFVNHAITANPGREIFGVDYFGDHVQLAKLLYPQHKSRFIQMSAYQLAFADKSIDCITFQEIIEHLEGAAIAIKEINRVLRPGGCLILSTTNPYYWRDLLVFIAKEFRASIGGRNALSPLIYFENVEWNRHIFSWTPSTLMTLLAVNGFEYVEHHYSRDGSGFFDKILLRLFPFFGPTQILKVRKKEDASSRQV